MHKLQKKLHQLSALSAAFLASGNVIGQSVEFENIEPDTLINGYEDVPYSIDMDNDGNDDIVFKFDNVATSFFSNPTIRIQQDHGASSWSFAWEIIPGHLVADAFLYNELISSDDNWLLLEPAKLGEYSEGNVVAQAYYMSEGAGPTYGDKYGIVDKDNKFIGIRKYEAPDYYYGWIRVSCQYTPPDDGGQLDFTIHEYAFNNIPNDPILAGETGLDCNAPFPLSTADMLATAKVRIDWVQVIDAMAYKVRYRPAGSSIWITNVIAHPKTSKVINGLFCDTEYEWQVAASCDGGTTFSSYSDFQTFNTGECRLSSEVNSSQAVLIYPTLVKEFVYIDLDEINEITTIKIFTIGGQLIQQLKGNENDFLKLDFSEYQSGIYIMNVKGNSIDITEKIVKE
jgi:hypothetical protein